MKKTSFFDGPAFVFRTIRGLAAAALVATALLSALPLTTRADDMPAAAKVDGQISVILEGWIDGEDAFVFRDGKVSIQHKSFKIPYEITVNGKAWTDLSRPFELGFTPDPAKTQFTCEGRGTSKLIRTDDGVTVSIYDQQGAGARYRIILFQPSGVKNPLALPKKPIEKTVMELPTDSTLVSLAGEPAAAKVDGQISVILEGWIDGEDAFAFRDGNVSIQHKSFKVPYEITVNGKAWTDLSRPFELGFTPDPAKTQFTCEGRGTSGLIRTDDDVTISIYDHQGAGARYRIILFQPSGVKNPLALPKKPIEKTVMELPTDSTLESAALAGEPAAAKVNGQISVILEGWIDGEDAFVFRDGKVSIQHKSFKVPYEITVNGKAWTDLSKPFELGFTPDPAKTQFTCEGRGTSGMIRTDDDVTISIYDHQGAATRYRIILFQPSGVKNPLALPKKPIEKTVMELPTGSTLKTAKQTAKPSKTTAPEKKPPKTTAPAEKSAEDGGLVLEGTFEGRGTFLFMDKLIAYSHKEGTYPADVKINGKSWADLNYPVKLDKAAIPVRIIRKQARGTVTLLPGEDFARLEIDDHQDGSDSYRIEFGTN